MLAISVLYAPDGAAMAGRIADALDRLGLDVHCITDDFLTGDLALDEIAAIVIWSRGAQQLAALHRQANAAHARGLLIPVSSDGSPAPIGFEDLAPVNLGGWGGDDNDPRWRFVLEEIDFALQRARMAPSDLPAETGDPSPSQPSMSQPSIAASMSGSVPPPVHHVRWGVGAQERYAEDEDYGEDEGPFEQFVLRRRHSSPAPPPRRGFWTPLRAGLASFVLLTGVTVTAISVAPRLLTALEAYAERNAEKNEPEVADLAMVQPAAPPPSKDARGDQPSAAVQAAQTDFSTPIIRDAASERLTPPEDANPAETALHEEEAEDTLSLPETPFEDETFTDEQELAESAADETPLETSDIAESGAQTAEDAALTELMAAVTENNLPATEEETPTPAQDAAPVEASADQADPAPVEFPEYAGDFFKDCVECPEMRGLPAGSFRMGSPPGEASRLETEGPATNVVFAKGFAIATREVTFEQWQACVDEGGCAGYRPFDQGWGRGRRPVVNVSFEDAQRYAQWLSAKTGNRYRLPSEAEWEYAARAGSSAPFAFGRYISSNEANFNGKYPYGGTAALYRGRTTPVGSFPPNAFGLFDMHGNVWEWTADCWYGDHTGAGTDGSARDGACSRRVLKGGAWNSGGWRLRAAHRIDKNQTIREFDNGFRVARDLD